MVNGEVVDEAEHFTYLGSKVSTSRNGEEEILVRISKESHGFASLRGTCRSKNISQMTNIRFFKSNVLSTLLYGAESWKMTKTIIREPQMIILHYTMKMFGHILHLVFCGCLSMFTPLLERDFYFVT